MLLAPLSAGARELAVVVGASPLYRPECAEGSRYADARVFPDPCRVRGRDLEHTDADAWRLAFLLRSTLSPNHVLVFAEPDPEVAGWTFPGTNARFGDSISGPPTLPAIQEGLRRQVAAQGLPDSVRLFMAAHGTPGVGSTLPTGPGNPAPAAARWPTCWGPMSPSPSWPWMPATARP